MHRHINFYPLSPLLPSTPAASRTINEPRPFDQRVRVPIPRMIVFENFSFRITLSRKSRIDRVVAVNDRRFGSNQIIRKYRDL